MLVDRVPTITPPPFWRAASVLLPDPFKPVIIYRALPIPLGLIAVYTPQGKWYESIDFQALRHAATPLSAPDYWTDLPE